MKRIRIPKSVRITPRITYQVFVLDPKDPRLEGHHGMCISEIKEILIAKDSGKTMLETFLHEVMHAMDNEYGLEIPHPLMYRAERPLARICRLNHWF